MDTGEATKLIDYFRSQPERLKCASGRIDNPHCLALQAEVFQIFFDQWGWPSSGRKNGVRVENQTTTSRALPLPRLQTMRWNQVVRLVVQAAMERRTQKRSGRCGSRCPFDQSLNPSQPSQVFYR